MPGPVNLPRVITNPARGVETTGALRPRETSSEVAPGKLSPDGLSAPLERTLPQKPTATLRATSSLFGETSTVAGRLEEARMPDFVGGHFEPASSALDLRSWQQSVRLLGKLLGLEGDESPEALQARVAHVAGLPAGSQVAITASRNEGQATTHLLAAGLGANGELLAQTRFSFPDPKTAGKSEPFRSSVADERASSRVLSADREHVTTLLERIHPGATLEDLHALAGAPPSAHVVVRADGENLAFSILHPDVSSSDVKLSRGVKGKPRIELDTLRTSERAARGTGSQITARALTRAQALGFENHALDAYLDRKQGWVGPLVWPKLGYDAKLPRRLAWQLPRALKRSQTVQDLIAKPGGFEWWTENHRATYLPMSFDLTEGSRSWEVLNHYLQTRGIET